MRKPTFFIIGAPKCGTTSFANWLGAHSNVFLTENPKEPKFFDTDVSPNVMTLPQYESLFRDAKDTHIAIGEASTTYLRSIVAVPGILKYAEQPKFIVCLRNPVEMAPSVHGQLCHTLYEEIEDFTEAWAAQSERAEGLRIPKHCIGEEERLQFGRVCSLGAQLERLYQVVAREQVHCVFVEDMKQDPRRCYQETLQFLGLPDDGRAEFPVANARKQPRAKWMSVLLKVLGRLKVRVGLGGRHFGLLRSAHQMNRVPAAKVELDASMRQELVEYFREDINLLSKITERDLSHWLK
ncbi:sulfotransferase domain-containing protein [Opitutales bacterium]|nr:sulfotransferase domain-containing protein [Opitutales bacterium]MDB2681509.1 sulfotransferase domain-containing protein [Opitutales bacterium]